MIIKLRSFLLASMIVACSACIAAVCLPLCWGLAFLVRSLPGAKRVLQSLRIR